MNKKILVLIAGLFTTVLCMDKDKKASLGQLPKELRTIILQFITTADLKKIDTLWGLLNRLDSLSKVGPFTSIAQGFYKDLLQIQNLKYDDALKKVKELSHKESFAALFNDVDFIRIIGSALYEKAYIKAFYNGGDIKEINKLIKELNTPGAQKWLEHLEFIEAARAGNIDAVKKYLAEGIDINAKGVSANTALIESSVGGGNKVMAQLLIDKGANVNAQNSEGYTALHYAVQKIATNRGLVETLFAAGADLIRDKNGYSPLIYAGQKHSWEVSELAIKYGAKRL